MKWFKFKYCTAIFKPKKSEEFFDILAEAILGTRLIAV